VSAAPAEGQPVPARKYALNPWPIAFTVTIATFMEALDSSIANVALPHIAGSLSATADQATWVLTSYLVSSGIIIPLGAWLSEVMGRKRFYMTCVALFTVCSFLCGIAPSLGMLIVFRVLQGAGGGGLQPSEQAILADTFPPQRLGMAFAIYGMAVVLAPSIGPTLGGWITDNYSWRWIFYINVPIGIISLLLTNHFVQDPPYLKERMEQQRRGESTDAELRIVRTDGSIRWIRSRGFPIKDANGGLSRLAGLAEDRTIQRKGKQARLIVSQH